jgi:hypothetical protein
MGHPTIPCPCGQTAHPWTASTGSNMTLSIGGPLDHAACDAEIARLRARAERPLPLAGCPTPCDPDCEAACHQSHEPVHKRWHDPGWSCQETQRAIAEAVAAERERIAKLADDAEAVYDPDGSGVGVSFADLIREGP